MKYSFNAGCKGKITIEQLTQKICSEHTYELLNLINMIPHIQWGKSDLLSQEKDLYNNKWEYSYALKNEHDEIIGVLIAYFRISDEKHIFDSLYLHRLAIAPEYQNNGIGTIAVKYFVTKAFKEIPWLLNISAQTNNDSGNANVIQFYKNLGFSEMYEVSYPDKTDVLFLIERRNFDLKNSMHIEFNPLNLRHPRLNMFVNASEKINVLPVIYFSSTNQKKKEIVQFIFHNYNIEVTFLKPPVDLTEPQIESSEPAEERKLVSLPLKAISRFIDNVPYTIEDTMLFIEYFNRNGTQWELPGLDTKRWLRQIGLDGLLDIMGGTDKRKARFVSQTGAYVKANEYRFGRAETTGIIALKKSQIVQPLYGTYPYFFHLLFIPDGANKTLAEMDMHEYAQYDYMRKSIVQLIQQLNSNDELERQYTLFDRMDGMLI